MLSGLLHPTSGEVEVLGHVPWRRRRDYLRQITLVMGNRNQLVWDIPAADSFELNRAIYRIPTGAFRETLDELVELLDLSALLQKPVRQLSLGQRMRCEVAASLLHRPKLVLLDEPSIGLDVVAKQHIRDAIRRMAQEENVGVLLTSHDAGDLEALCRRVIIINHGQIVYEDKVSNLKRKFLTRKMVEVRYAEEVSKGFSINGVEILKIGHYGVKLRFDTTKTPVDAVMSHLSEAGELVDITVSDPPLEDVIAKIYEQANKT
jgi:ABC-2 type transport system ATP-binding protein